MAMQVGPADAGGEDQLNNTINTTPLVDVTLTLLIVFIVTASFVVDRTMPVELPKAASAEATSPSLLNVAITASGEVFLNGAPARLDDIPAAVAACRPLFESSTTTQSAGGMPSLPSTPCTWLRQLVRRPTSRHR